jgi:hypothetical protein
VIAQMPTVLQYYHHSNPLQKSMLRARDAQQITVALKIKEK